MESLLADGHRDAWSYTPRQLQGYLDLANRRHKRDGAKQLSIGAAAARGDPRKVNKQIKDWNRP